MGRTYAGAPLQPRIRNTSSGVSQQPRLLRFWSGGSVSSQRTQEEYECPDDPHVRSAIDRLAEASAGRWLSAHGIGQHFRNYANGDGKIGREEWLRVLVDLGLKLDDETATSIFSWMNTDKSGSIDTDDIICMLLCAMDRKMLELKQTIKRHPQQHTVTGNPYADPGLPSFKMVALVAHNEMKASMLSFVAEHMWLFQNVPIITTNSTGKTLEDNLGIHPAHFVSSGPLGGDQEIGGEVSNGRVGLLLFFCDPLTAHPHEADIQALCRIANVHDIPWAANPTSAEALMIALKHAPIGTILKADTHVRRPSSRVDTYKSQQKLVIDGLSKDNGAEEPEAAKRLSGDTLAKGQNSLGPPDEIPSSPKTKFFGFCMGSLAKGGA